MGFPGGLVVKNPPASVTGGKGEGHKIWKNDKTQGRNIRIKVVESAIFDTFDSNIASLGFVILSDLVPFPFPSCNTGRWILYH